MSHRTTRSGANTSTVSTRPAKLEPAREPDRYLATPAASSQSTDVKREALSSTPLISEQEKSIPTSQHSIKSKSTKSCERLSNSSLSMANSSSLKKSETNEQNVLTDNSASEFSKLSTFTSRVDATAKDSRISFLDLQKSTSQNQVEEEMKQFARGCATDEPTKIAKAQEPFVDTRSRANEKDIMVFRRSKNLDCSRDSSPESYEYLVTLRKVSARTNNQPSQLPVQLNCSLNETSQSSSSVRSMSEINVDEEFFNENTIKEVVEQCFEELSRNKRLSNTYVSLKGEA